MTLVELGLAESVGPFSSPPLDPQAGCSPTPCSEALAVLADAARASTICGVTAWSTHGLQLCVDQPFIEEGPLVTIQIGSSGAANHHRNFADPTQAQMAALARYTEDPAVPAPLREGIRLFLMEGRMTYAIAWDTIGMIKEFLSKKGDMRIPVTEGIYVDPSDDSFYLVKRSNANRLYAMGLFIHSSGVRNEDGTWKQRPKFEWRFEAGKGRVFKLDGRWKATQEQIKKWGDLTGHCIKCHAELTRQDSIDRGMGKACWDRQFG